ncbi:MAG: hypothetical protein WAO07_04350, partial [Desulfobacterales bacterium]
DTIWQHLAKDRLKIQRILRKMPVRTIPEERLRRLDPQLTSFFNINSPADLIRAETLLGAKSAGER